MFNAEIMMKNKYDGLSSGVTPTSQKETDRSSFLKHYSQTFIEAQ